MNLLPVIPLPLKNSKGANKDANKAPRNPSSYFFISFSTISVTTTINTPESVSGFMILIT